MKETFYSNGKLLITGEYLVLDGATAFALPTKFGQSLIVEKSANQNIHWKSFDSDGQIWFEDSISFSEIKNALPQEKESIKSTLISILHAAYILNPAYITNASGYTITTQLTFPKQWGLGTSSTLINNIAQWLQIDAFTLLNNSFGGSGYDIACAQNNGPIIYHLERAKPIVEKVLFNPDFLENLYFVYLNKKQNSKAAIQSYYNQRNNNLGQIIATNNQITQAVLNANTLKKFTDSLQEHEAKLSIILKMKTVKETLFPDFNGVVKSLGAWGGDFVLATATNNPTDYFISKGYKTIIPYKEMIL